MRANQELSPRTLARLVAVLGFLEGSAAVWGQLRIPGRLVVSTDAAATAANILANESLFRLGLALTALAVALNAARTVFAYLLFRPVGRAGSLIYACFALLAIGLQAAGAVAQLPALVALKGGEAFGAFGREQVQALALLFLRWSGQTFNFYLAFFGLCCFLVGYLVLRSTFVPRLLGALMVLAGAGYATYFWPPLANALYPYNLALGVGELALGLWLLVRGVNVERWRAQARATAAGEARLVAEG